MKIVFMGTPHFEVPALKALAESAKKNEELLNKMASDKEALKEIRELYEALSKSQNADKATKEKLEEMIAKGMSKADMCRELNITSATLRKKFYKFNLKY